jgi:hypothetical protein
VKNTISTYLAFFSVYLIVSNTSIYAQDKSLVDLLSESVVFSSSISDENNVHGYLIISELGKLSKDLLELEYYYYDKNLNPVLRGTFTKTIRYLKASDFSRVSYFDGKLLISVVTPPFNSHTYNDNSFYILDIEKNIMSSEFTYEAGKIVLLKDKKQGSTLLLTSETDSKEYVVGSVANGVDGGVYLFNNKLPFQQRFKSLKMFNLDQSLRWSYEVEEAHSKEKKYLTPLGSHGDYIYATEYLFEKKKFVKRDFIIFSIKDGKQVLRYNLEKKGENHLHEVIVRTIDGKIYLGGLFFPLDGSDAYSVSKSSGVYWKKFNIDGKLEATNYLHWKDVNSDKKIKPVGKIDKSWIASRTYFVMKDGSLNFILQKTKNDKYKKFISGEPVALGKSYYSVDFLDLIGDIMVLNVPPSIKKNKINEIEMGFHEPQKDFFLYAQYIKEQDCILIINETFKGDKSLKNKFVLNVISGTSIKNDYFEIFPGPSIENFINRAKSGFIMVTEVDRSKKTYSIRLEKINI